MIQPIWQPKVCFFKICILGLREAILLLPFILVSLTEIKKLFDHRYLCNCGASSIAMVKLQFKGLSHVILNFEKKTPTDKLPLYMLHQIPFVRISNLCNKFTTNTFIIFNWITQLMMSILSLILFKFIAGHQCAHS